MMNFKKLRLYGISKEDGGGCVTLSINDERIIPVLEFIYRLKSKYTKMGPIKVKRLDQDGSGDVEHNFKEFNYNVIYHKEGAR